MRVRCYEPSTGRFISEEPASDGRNWYRYSNNNPVNFAAFHGCNAFWNNIIRIKDGAAFHSAALMIIVEFLKNMGVSIPRTVDLSAKIGAAALYLAGFLMQN